VFLLLARFAAGQYAGSQACQACHSIQTSTHSKTGHALALAKPAAHPLASSFRDVAADWAFGAGDQAVTFVSKAGEDAYVEHGLTWYRRSGGMGITPGHSGKSGERYRTFDPDSAILRCFQCHSTGPLRLADDFRIVPFEPGVQCEACHGPGGEHVERDGLRKAIRNPKAMSADELNQFCGTCHRMPPAAGSATNWSNPWNARHQPLYLSQSRCLVESKGALSCRTCHAAHQPVERNAARYDAVCSGCHAKPQHKSAVGQRTCVSCHMPAVRPNESLEFANHWIGVYGGNVRRPIGQTDAVTRNVP
jgi:hypothetical protein